MLLIFFAVLLFTVSVLLIICYYNEKSKPLCIYELAVNKEIPAKMEALRRTIDGYLQDDLFIIIIQDDIMFFDEKYYWPKRTAYIHLSDVNYFLQKYSQDKNNYSYDQIICFIKTKIKVY